MQQRSLGTLCHSPVISSSVLVTGHKHAGDCVTSCCTPTMHCPSIDMMRLIYSLPPPPFYNMVSIGSSLELQIFQMACQTNPDFR